MDQQEMMAALQRMCVQLDMVSGDGARLHGTVSKVRVAAHSLPNEELPTNALCPPRQAALWPYICRFFPEKTEDNLTELRLAVDSQFPGDTVNYARLLNEREDGTKVHMCCTREMAAACA